MATPKKRLALACEEDTKHRLLPFALSNLHSLLYVDEDAINSFDVARKEQFPPIQVLVLCLITSV